MSPELIRAETKALSSALNCLTGYDMGATITQVESVLRDRENLNDAADITTQCAMRFILGYPIEVPSFNPAKRPRDRHIFEVTAKSWIAWARKTDQEKALEDLQAVPTTLSGRKAALHLMALRPWKLAVEALLKKDALLARKLFHRASELSSHFGVESSPVIQWTYAASFFFSPTTL